MFILYPNILLLRQVVTLSCLSGCTLLKKLRNLQKLREPEQTWKRLFWIKKMWLWKKRDDWEEVQNYISAMNEARKVIDYLFQQPVIDASKIGAITEKSRATNYKLLDDLEKRDVLKEITGAQRNKLYIFNDYMQLFKNE